MAADSRRVRRWLVAVVVAVLAAVGLGAGTVFAHAELLSSTPAPGDVLTSPPSAITLHFDEHVEISLGAVRLFDGAGRSIDIGAAKHPSGDFSTVQVSLPKLASGSYVVDWQVVSADSHPVHAAYTFQVGAVDNLAAGVFDQILGASHSNGAAGSGLTISRFLVTVALAIVFGGLGAITFGIVPPSERLRRLILVAGGVGAMAGLLALPLEVAYATGRSLSAIVDGSAWSAVLDTGPGRAWAVRAALLLLATALALVWKAASTIWWRITFAAALLGAGVASAYGGHGASGRWRAVGIVATTVHIAGITLWLGGLAAIVVSIGVIDRRRAARFSAYAFTLVAVVIASGVVQSIRQVGSWHRFTSTTYGKLLIWKLVTVLVLLAVAAVGRKIATGRVVSNRHRADPAVALDRPRLFRAIGIEVVLALTVITLTSFLMAANPTAAASSPVSATLLDRGYLASISVTPGQRGPNELHIYLSSTQSSLDQPDSVTVTILDPARNVPIAIPVTRAGAAHYTNGQATFPYPATWTLTVVARYHEFDEYTFTTKVKIP